ncbi:MAG: hypothetical protein K1V67_03945, partial [Paramuribaculum intestinale]
MAPVTVLYKTRQKSAQRYAFFALLQNVSWLNRHKIPQYGLGGVIWRSVVSAGGRSVEAEFLADVVDAVEPLPGAQLYGAAET